ncbi:hypothetical protein VTN96DRAFT_763 [Rasamsonia emersonii]
MLSMIDRLFAAEIRFARGPIAALPCAPRGGSFPALRMLRREPVVVMLSNRAALTGPCPPHVARRLVAVSVAGMTLQGTEYEFREKKKAVHVQWHTENRAFYL